MTSSLRTKFARVYKNQLTSVDLSGYVSDLSFKRLYRRVPRRILNGEPISLTLTEDLVAYGRRLAKHKGDDKIVGETLAALGVATEIDRLADLYRDLRSQEEHRQLDFFVERNAQLKEFLERIHEENKDILPEEEQLILSGGILGADNHLQHYALVKYGGDDLHWLDLDKRYFTRERKQMEKALKKRRA